MTKTEATKPNFADQIIGIIRGEGKKLSLEDCENVKMLVWHLFGDSVSSKGATRILQSLKNPISPDYRKTPEYKDAQARCDKYLREYRSGDVNIDPDPFHLNPPGSKFS